MHITPMVKQLLILNIIFFAGSYFVPQAMDFFALYHFESIKFKAWQPLTHMFMHGGIMHILFNMFALVSFGSALEQFWGHRKFLFFYISCGLGAALLQSAINYLQIHSILEGAASLGLSAEELRQVMSIDFTQGNVYSPRLFADGLEPILNQAGKLSLLDEMSFKALFDGAIEAQTPMVGASGAIYGLLVAFAFMFPNAELLLMFIPVPVKAKYFVPGLLALDLILGVSGQPIFGGQTGVAHFAHIGGAIVGFIMMWSWKKNQFNQNRWD